jgi:hypothetical protein
MPDTKNLFISHVHEDDDRLQGLKDLLRSNGYDIRDGSIDSTKPNNARSPDYIWNEILAPRIRWAGTLLVLISPKTHESTWVNREIEAAHNQDKRIVGVYAHGGQESDLPESFQLYGDALVGWQADRIMDAINGKVEKWDTPEGSQIRAPRTIDRYNC